MRRLLRGLELVVDAAHSSARFRAGKAMLSCGAWRGSTLVASLPDASLVADLPGSSLITDLALLPGQPRIAWPPSSSSVAVQSLITGLALLPGQPRITLRSCLPGLSRHSGRSRLPLRRRWGKVVASANQQQQGNSTYKQRCLHLGILLFGVAACKMPSPLSTVRMQNRHMMECASAVLLCTGAWEEHP